VMYLTACGGFKGGYDEATLAKLATVARDQKVNMILVEPAFGGGMFSELMKPVLNKIYPCTLEETPWPSSQKELRIIDTLEPVMNQHRLVVDKALLRRDATDGDPADPHYGHRRLVHQLTRMQRAKGALRHDDRLDALTMAVAYWLEQVGVDINDAAAERRGDEIDKLLDGWLDPLNEGTLPRQTNWLARSGLENMK